MYSDESAEGHIAQAAIKSLTTIRYKSYIAAASSLLLIEVSMEN
jgi:hypothetical protein